MFQSIDVVVPVFSLKKIQVDRLINSLLNQEIPTVKKAYLFVIVNPVKLSEQDEWIKTLKSIVKSEIWTLTPLFLEMAGVNSARQMGLNAGRSDITFFFDDDVVLDEKTILAQHLEFHEEHPEFFACGGYYKSFKNVGLFQKVYLSRQNRWLNESFLDQQKLSVGYLLGGHFSIKRSLFPSTELVFDTQIVFGASETEFFLKACRFKLKLGLQKWHVTHELTDRPLRLLQKTFLQGRGKKYIESKGLFFQPLYRSTVSSSSVLENLITWLFDLTISWGYHSYDRNYAEFFKIHLKKAWLQIGYQRQRLINYLRSDL